MVTHVRGHVIKALAVTAVLVAATARWADASDVDFVAGVEPSKRPATAPTLTETKKGSGWYTEALTGVDRPYPYSLRFLEDQEAWYTPFTRPGMIGPYDIRGWHENE